MRNDEKIDINLATEDTSENLSEEELAQQNYETALRYINIAEHMNKFEDQDKYYHRAIQYLKKAKPYYMQFEEERKQAIQNGEIRPIEPITLLLDILSMNTFIFFVYPSFCNITGIELGDFEKIVETRKKEVITLITNGLRP